MRPSDALRPIGRTGPSLTGSRADEQTEVEGDGRSGGTSNGPAPRNVSAQADAARQAMNARGPSSRVAGSKVAVRPGAVLREYKSVVPERPLTVAKAEPWAGATLPRHPCSGGPLFDGHMRSIRPRPQLLSCSFCRASRYCVIGEIAIYNRPLTAAERSRLNHYFWQKVVAVFTHELTVTVSHRRSAAVTAAYRRFTACRVMPVTASARSSSL
jgi:hypothetical protein